MLLASIASNTAMSRVLAALEPISVGTKRRHCGLRSSVLTIQSFRTIASAFSMACRRWVGKITHKQGAGSHCLEELREHCHLSHVTKCAHHDTSLLALYRLFLANGGGSTWTGLCLHFDCCFALSIPVFVLQTWQTCTVVLVLPYQEVRDHQAFRQTPTRGLRSHHDPLSLTVQRELLSYKLDKSKVQAWTVILGRKTTSWNSVRTYWRDYIHFKHHTKASSLYSHLSRTIPRVLLEPLSRMAECWPNFEKMPRSSSLLLGLSSSLEPTRHR
jgi:hypothetical protein